MEDGLVPGEECGILLIGTYEHNLDAKGRLQVPARLRPDLGDLFIGTKGTGPCIFLFDLDQWALLTQKLKALPLSDRAAQGFLRTLSACAFECAPDAQGRILVPRTLRSKIGLAREAVVAGCMNRAEIWPRDRWEEYMASTDDAYEEILEQLKDAGI